MTVCSVKLRNLIGKAIWIFVHGFVHLRGAAQLLKRTMISKGQVLMMYLSGQALAVAEQLEEEKKTQQKFSELKGRLESVFTTVAWQEAKMVAFENIQ